MKNQSSNPNQDSTSSPPPPSPPPPTPEPQVVSEDPAENGNADPKSPPADVAEDPAVNAPVQEVTARFEVGSAASAAMTAEAMGHVMLSAMNGGSGNNLRVKLPIKRKSVAIVSDSSGKPQTCRVCSQRFPTWRVMYQHVMEIHLTAPPPPPPQPQPVIHRQGGNGFDLNLNEAVESDELVLQIAPPAAPTGHENKKEQAASSSSSSSSSAAAPAHDDVAPEKVKFPFDLNELPPDEDDDDDTAALN